MFARLIDPPKPQPTPMPMTVSVVASLTPSANPACVSAAQPEVPHAAPGNPPLGAWLTRMLDEIDYGMLLVGTDDELLYCNHAARLELDGEHPLQLAGGALRVLRSQDLLPLQVAIDAARRGLRRLVTLGTGAQRVSVSVVPLPGGAADAHPGEGLATLLVLGKRQVCSPLSVQGFARSLNLTPAETRVLELLCAGVRPTAIAQQQKVAVSTVRTQIGSIRAKTGATSISELVRQVAVLPPLVGALRGVWSQGAS